MTHALPLVLLPGLHGTTGLLEPLAVRLGAHRPVHPIDYPGDARLDLAGYIAHVLERLPAKRFADLDGRPALSQSPPSSRHARPRLCLDAARR